MSYAEDTYDQEMSEMAAERALEDALDRLLTRYQAPFVNACVTCESEFKRKHPSQKFCSLKCKDRYHNLANPERRERAKQYV